jgi:hypothetical protein
MEFGFFAKILNLVFGGVPVFSVLGWVTGDIALCALSREI